MRMALDRNFFKPMMKIDFKMMKKLLTASASAMVLATIFIAPVMAYEELEMAPKA